MRIRNSADHPVFIERIDPESHQPLPHEFSLTSNGKEVNYIGPMIKRPPYAREDFRWLQPGESVERNLSIENLFEFLPGNHEYKVTHIFLGFDEATGQVTEHETEAVTFAYTRAAVEQLPR